MASLGWLPAQHPPGKFDDQKTFYQVNQPVFMAHAKAGLAYREMGGTGKIGASFAYTPSYALDCKPFTPVVFIVPYGVTPSIGLYSHTQL